MHTIEELLKRLTLLDEKSKDDLMKFLVDCRSFIHSKGPSHRECQILSNSLELYENKLFTKKQIQVLFSQDEEEDVISLHFKQQRLGKHEREEFQKLIKEKKKPKNILLENIIIEDEMTPITPSSPRFLIYYDFVYIPELISQIFQYLPFKDHCKMKRVCKLWQSISEDELLFKFKFIDSYTIYEGEPNYKKDVSIIKLKENSKEPIYGSWKELCSICNTSEKRHKDMMGPIILNSKDESFNPYDNYNRLYCARISRDGTYCMAGGQTSSVGVMKVNDVLNMNVEKFTDESGHQRITLQELFTGRRPKETKTQRERIKLHCNIPTSDVGWTISDLDFSYDSSVMAYSTWNTYIPVISVSDPSKRIEIPLTDDDEGRYCAFSVRFSSNNKELLTGCSDGTLYVCDYNQGKVVSQVVSSSDDLNAVSFGGDDYPEILFTGGDDCICKIWDKRDLKKPVGVLIGHKYGIASVSAKGDGIHYISSSKDQTIKLWDIRKLSGTDTGILKLKSVQDSMNPMNWDYRYPEMIPQNQLLEKSPYDKSIMTYHGHHKLFKTLIRCDFSPAFSTGQKYIYTGSTDGNVILYDVATGKLAHKVKAASSLIREVAWHPYLPMLLASSWDTKMSCVSYTGKLGDLKFIQE